MNHLPCCPDRPACGQVGMDSNTDFFGRERFVSLKRYVRARREPREYSHDHGQQTERCNRVRRIRLCRRHCDRRVLGFPFQA